MCFSDKTIRENTYKCLAVIHKKVGEKVMGVFTSEMKDDKKKMIEDAVAELKNAGGDGPATSAAPAKAASPVKPKTEPNFNVIAMESANSMELISKVFNGVAKGLDAEKMQYKDLVS